MREKKGYVGFAVSEIYFISAILKYMVGYRNSHINIWRRRITHIHR